LQDLARLFAEMLFQIDGFAILLRPTQRSLCACEEIVEEPAPEQGFQGRQCALMARELLIVIVANIQLAALAVLNHGDAHRCRALAANIAHELSHLRSPLEKWGSR